MQFEYLAPSALLDSVFETFDLNSSFIALISLSFKTLHSLPGTGRPRGFPSPDRLSHGVGGGHGRRRGRLRRALRPLSRPPEVNRPPPQHPTLLPNSAR